MSKKESFVNALSDAVGIVIIFTAGYFGFTYPTWFSPFYSVFSMMLGYFLVKATVTFPEETRGK